jgi:hypothetical protein
MFPRRQQTTWSAEEGASISIKGLELTASSVRCAPAFGSSSGRALRARPLTAQEDCSQKRTIRGQRYEDYAAGVGGWQSPRSEACEEKDGGGSATGDRPFESCDLG